MRRSLHGAVARTVTHCKLDLRGLVLRGGRKEGGVEREGRGGEGKKGREKEGRGGNGG